MNDYVGQMRKAIGNDLLFTVGCGCVIEDEHGRILLQRRKDQNNWCIPGGVMEVNEYFEDAARREVLEETNLQLTNLELFGVYSGPSCYKEYPNGDKIFSVQIIFYSNRFEGELIQEGEESFEHVFFDRSSLPSPLNSNQAPFILDWANEKRRPIIR